MPWFALYTAPFREAAVAARLGLCPGVEAVFLPALQASAAAAMGDETARLLFTNYVFFRAPAHAEEVFETVASLEGVRRLVGVDQRRPSAIKDYDIEVLRELCASDRHPTLGPVPASGRVARIISGPMAGATGIVKQRRGNILVLAFTMPILAGAYELALAEDQVQVLDERVEVEKAKRPRHRGGKRARRSRGEEP